MSESRFTRKIATEITEDGGIVIPIIASQQSFSWPDRLVYHRLWHGLMEFKTVDGRVRPNQRENIRKLNLRQRCSAVIVREPNKCETHDGELIFEFVNGKDLMEKLASWREILIGLSRHITEE